MTPEREKSLRSLVKVYTSSKVDSDDDYNGCSVPILSAALTEALDALQKERDRLWALRNKARDEASLAFAHYPKWARFNEVVTSDIWNPELYDSDEAASIGRARALREVGQWIEDSEG